MKIVELFDKFSKKCNSKQILIFIFLDPQNCPFYPRIKKLRSTFGARRPEQESIYIVTIACRVTERERNLICRRRRHSRKQQNYCRPKQQKVKKKFIFEKWGYF